MNVPEDYDLASFREHFERADAAGVKGLAVFRTSSARRGILSSGPPDAREAGRSRRAACLEIA